MGDGGGYVAVVECNFTLEQQRVGERIKIAKMCAEGMADGVFDSEKKGHYCCAGSRMYA